MVKVVAAGENIYTIEELRQTGKVSLIYVNHPWDPTMETSLTINEPGVEAVKSGVNG